MVIDAVEGHRAIAPRPTVLAPERARRVDRRLARPHEQEATHDHHATADETEDAYVERFMADPAMIQAHPTPRDRAVRAYRSWRERQRSGPDASMLWDRVIARVNDGVRRR
jgi:hypothetical protein